MLSLMLFRIASAGVTVSVDQPLACFVDVLTLLIDHTPLCHLHPKGTPPTACPVS